ncbi:hypothetical protein [Campylobacter cuniculorum]|uniref:Phage-Barnase-EndoU-ColicinE5/D-RelE like nuclease 3 domain-containing protein n=2 Tax=Campylobacter cuniculorum TaxID=374106 RepID=A0A1W6BVL0_9BACT|nr:hypothetical protein [Campylobacter cuniculorum]ARJ56139.1 hypothetical protein CCUN_0499 [Campylobacter cuniculorum DSM 23162 = LMG 24588]QOR03629.1 hypothetical protein A0071_05370 [Campylobacter cuniculorum]
MFRDKKEVKEVIERAVSKPKIIINNSRIKSEKDFIVAKRLDNKKMENVRIRNDNGTSMIYHTNKKKITEFDRLKEKSRW